MKRSGIDVTSTALLDKLAFELARQYAAGWNQRDSDQHGAHLVSVAKQKRRARVWARANAHLFRKEAQQLLSNALLTHGVGSQKTQSKE